MEAIPPQQRAAPCAWCGAPPDHQPPHFARRNQDPEEPLVEICADCEAKWQETK